MKKLISLVAALTMLASVFSMVPAQATPYAEYPYIYEDLENGASDGFGLQSNSTGAVHSIVKDPTERSSKVYKVSIAPDSEKTFSFVEASQTKDIPVVMGTTMKSSLMVYMATGTPRTNNVSIVYSIAGTTLTPDGEKSEQSFTGWFEQTLKPEWQIGQWTKLESTVTWTKDLAYGVSGSTPLNGNTIDYDSIKITVLRFRIGTSNNAEFIVDETKLVEGAESLDFYFDEMIYEPVPDQAVEELVYGQNLFTYGDFENGLTSGFYANADGGANKFLATTKTENGNTFLNIANPDGLYAWNQLEYIGGEHANIRMLPNRMYEFTFRYRVNEMYDSGKTCGTAAGGEYADVYFKWGIGNGTGANEKLDMNGLWTSGNWPTGKYAQEDPLVLDGQWHEAKINFTFDSKTFAEPLFRDTPFRATIVFQAHQSNMWAPMHMDMDMDDIKLIDCGPITNGSFEQTSGYATRWVNSQGTGATATNTGYGVYGWLPDGCTLTSSDVVRENSESTKSMKVTLNAGGRPLQALSLDPKEAKRYKLSFWAKDDTLEDGASVPFAFCLERTSKVTEAQEAEVYKVPDYEFYTGTNEKVSGGWVYNSSVMENQEWRLTNEWQYFETYIDTEYPVIAGKENASTANILPRQPFMFFIYNGTNPAGAEYYIDDVSLQPATPADLSVFAAENVVVTGESELVAGDEITVTWDVKHIDGTQTEQSENALIRVYTYGEGGMVSVGSAKATEPGKAVVKATSAMVGKGLVFEVVPVDVNGKYGQPAQSSFDGMVVLAIDTALFADEAKENITWKAATESFIKYDSLTAYIAMYKANGQLLTVTTANVDYAHGSGEFGATVPVAEDAAYAKLMLVDGNLSPKASVKTVSLVKEEQPDTPEITE